MKNEDLVIHFFPMASAFGRTFAATHGQYDRDEWESIACFELVQAALRFERPPEHHPNALGAFWVYARRFIFLNLLDRYRANTNDGMRSFVGLDPCQAQRSHESSVMARVLLDRKCKVLTNRQRQIIAIRRDGGNSKDVQEMLGMNPVNAHWQTSQALARLRAACGVRA